MARPAPFVRIGTSTSFFMSAETLASISDLTRPCGCGERMMQRSQASAAPNETFSPGRPCVKPLPSLPSVSMKMKTICTAKPTPMRHGSSSAEFTSTSKSTFFPRGTRRKPVTSKEPGLYTASVG